VSEIVYRVSWRPGADQLLGTCHCGAEHLAEDPIELWAWLLDHPDGHEPFATDRVTALDAGAGR